MRLKPTLTQYALQQLSNVQRFPLYVEAVDLADDALFGLFCHSWTLRTGFLKSIGDLVAAGGESYTLSSPRSVKCNEVFENHCVSNRE